MNLDEGSEAYRNREKAEEESVERTQGKLLYPEDDGKKREEEICYEGMIFRDLKG